MGADLDERTDDPQRCCARVQCASKLLVPSTVYQAEFHQPASRFRVRTLGVSASLVTFIV